jgi:succinate-semialdehyde dehydrogenase/glutarate-semialdehyde dehydrogenase
MNERTYELKIDKKSEPLRLGFLLGERWLDGSKGPTFAVENPYDNSLVARLPDLGEAEVREAIAIAAAAQSAWRAAGSRTRAAVLQRWHELILDNVAVLSQILTAEQGKPLSEAEGEIRYAASYVHWYAQEALRIVGDTFDAGDGRDQALIVKEPVGVVAAITPWNFPAAMVTRKVAPALAAGCSLVLKPAHETPLTAIALVQLALAAGVPAGVLNIVSGTDAAAFGAELCRNKAVNKLTFTGSTRVGKILQEQAANTVKRLSMELGGNAPLLVFDDANIDDAVAGILQSKFRNSGQTCICVNRVLVQEAIYDKVAARLAEVIADIRLGDGRDSETDLGPLIHRAACQRVETLVQRSVAAGAKLLCGTSQGSSNFFAPTVLTEVSQSMPVFREEIFGPVIALTRFSNEAEALALANASEAGLAAYVYTQDLSRSWRVSRALDVGMVGVNKTAISSELVPFGGVKESGYGREGSRHGLDDYLEMKYITMAVSPQ